MTDGFYNELGRIADKDVASEVANLEKPARAREAELKRQIEIGLTPDQEKNIAIMELIKTKYPDAFEARIDDNGRQILVVDMILTAKNSVGLNGVLFITQEGILQLSSTKHANDQLIKFPTDVVFDTITRAKVVSKHSRNPGNWIPIRYDAVNKDFGTMQITVDGKMADVIGDDRQRDHLKEALTTQQDLGAERKKRVATSAAARSIKKVLDDL